MIPTRVYHYRDPAAVHMGLGELRRKAFYANNGPKAITPKTRVRVTGFLSYKEARHFPENNGDPIMEVRPRKEVNIPKGVLGVHNILPRMVLIDLPERGKCHRSVDLPRLELEKQPPHSLTCALQRQRPPNEEDKSEEEDRYKPPTHSLHRSPSTSRLPVAVLASDC